MTVNAPAETSQQAVSAQFPHWHLWHGIASLCYARRRRSSPAVVVRAHNWTALAGRIRAAEARLKERP